MSRYTTIYTKIWQDEKFTSLDDDGKMLFLYLLSSPHGNLIGLYYLPQAYIAADLRWAIERVSEGLSNLCETGLIRYDNHAQVVHVRNFLRYNPIQNPNQAKGAIGILDDLPKSPLLSSFLSSVKEFCPRFYKLISENAKPFLNGLETLSKPETESETETESESDIKHTCEPPAPSAPVYDEPVEKIFGEDMGGAQSKDSGKGQVPPAEKPVSEAFEYSAEFETFWSYYPRRVEKRAAYKAWKARLKDRTSPITADQLIQAAKNYAESCKALRTEPRFIKHASTFLGPSRPYEDYLHGVPEGIPMQTKVHVKSEYIEKLRRAGAR